MSRVRPSARILVSIRQHKKTAGTVWPSNDLFASFCRLLIYGIEQYAAKRKKPEDVGVVYLNLSQLKEVTGKKRVDSAARVMQELEKSGLIICRSSAALWSIRIPKFAKHQGIGTKNVTPQSQSQSQSQIQKKSKSKSKKKIRLRVEPPEVRATRAPRPDSTVSVAIPDWALDLSRQLALSVQAQRPGTKVPETNGTLVAWAKVFVLLHGRGPSPEEITERTAWVFSEANLSRGQYAIVARSPAAIAAKWDRIADGMDRASLEAKKNETIEERGARITKEINDEQ